jgi:hypothetical protein
VPVRWLPRTATRSSFNGRHQGTARCKLGDEFSSPVSLCSLSLPPTARRRGRLERPKAANRSRLFKRSGATRGPGPAEDVAAIALTIWQPSSDLRQPSDNKLPPLASRSCSPSPDPPDPRQRGWTTVPIPAVPQSKVLGNKFPRERRRSPRRSCQIRERGGSIARQSG